MVPMADDPPWLDEAASAARDAYLKVPPLGSDWPAVVRAVLAFATRAAQTPAGYSMIEASPIGADPPWLGEAACALWIEFSLWHAPTEWPTWGELLAQGHQGAKRIAEFRQYARVLLALASRQPREITEAEVEAGATAIHARVSMEMELARVLACAALEAAEKARRGG